jgi:hypothetical protein
MKKFIQTISFLALALVFGGISANAQQTTKIDANVSFDFIVGDQYLTAGEYVIRVSPSPGGVKTIEVRSKKGDVLYTGLVMPNGDTGRGRSELVFDKSNERTVLKKILTGDAGYSVPTVDISKLTASAN